MTWLGNRGTPAIDTTHFRICSFCWWKDSEAHCANNQSKLCNMCSTWTASHRDLELEPIPFHVCRKNHEGSSGSMEALACLEMTVDLFDTKNCIVSTICIDDDASTRSMLQWNNDDYMINNKTTVKPMSLITKGPNTGKPQVCPDDRGRLPGRIPEPIFVALD
jgi:hypothetical protein